MIVIVIIIIIVNPPTEGSLQIVKRAADTNLLQGDACFQVTGQGNDIEVCDNDGVDQNTTVGVILLTELAEGDYTIHETQAPPGYDPAADQTATVVGGLKTVGHVQGSEVEHARVAHDSQDGRQRRSGDRHLLRAAPGQQQRSMDRSATTTTAPMTARSSFTNVTPGNYTLRETTTAGPNWQPIADRQITVIAGENPDLPVVNTLKTGIGAHHQAEPGRHAAAARRLLRARSRQRTRVRDLRQPGRRRRSGGRDHPDQQRAAGRLRADRNPGSAGLRCRRECRHHGPTRADRAGRGAQRSRLRRRPMWAT